MSVPVSGASWPASTLSSVDFPAPFAPRNSRRPRAPSRIGESDGWVTRPCTAIPAASSRIASPVSAASGAVNVSGSGGSGPALAPEIVDAALEQSHRTRRSALASVLGRALAGLPVARSCGASGDQPLRELALGVEARGIPSAPLAQRPGARLAVRGKASAEQGAPGAECRVEVEDRRRDRVEQPPIVRHEHSDPPKLDQPLHKPVQRAVVEVVARLIEQHGAGRVSQCAAEPQAVALADREAGKRLFGVELRIEGVQRRLQSPLGVPRAQPLGVGERGCVALAGALCARGEARRSDAERGQRVARRSQRLCTHRSDRRPGWRVHLLLDEGATLGRPPHVAAVGHEPAREQPQQRALSGAVVADHSEALPGGDGERDARRARRRRRIPCADRTHGDATPGVNRTAPRRRPAVNA